jgi:hypothetical protein
MPNLPTNVCDACSDAEVYMQAVEEAVKHRLDNSTWPPKLNGECSIQWRVSKASCWASWTRIIYDITPEPVVEWKQISVNKPCNSDCCLRRMEVCKDSTSGAIRITDLGSFDNSFACDSLFYNTTDFLEPPSSIPCYYTCDMLENWQTTFLKQAIMKPEEYINDFNPQENELMLEVNINQTKDNIYINIQNASVNDFKVVVANLDGQVISEINSTIMNGEGQIVINTSQYISGAYIINLVVEGIQVKSDKFIIAR